VIIAYAARDPVRSPAAWALWMAAVSPKLTRASDYACLNSIRAHRVTLIQNDLELRAIQPPSR
jgi:hypothetical protein